MDTEYLKRHYDSLNTEELAKLRLSDLASEARLLLEAELAQRNDQEQAVQAVSNAVSSLRPLDVDLLAPIWRRFAAGILDFGGLWIVLFAINFPAYLFTPEALSDLIGYASLTCGVAYFFFKDGMNGQSVGKRLLGIKVLERSTGDPCGLPRSLLRNAFHGLGFFDWIFALGRESRRLGDHIAGTYVVRVDSLAR